MALVLKIFLVTNKLEYKKYENLLKQSLQKKAVAIQETSIKIFGINIVVFHISF